MSNNIFIKYLIINNFNIGSIGFEIKIQDIDIYILLTKLVLTKSKILDISAT